MEYKVLYRKYRPDCFKNIIGQDYTIKMLQNAIINNKIAHSYLFTGPRGTGKTSTAKVFAKTINCEHLIDGEACGKCSSCLSFNNSPDIIEIDAASNNGVDDIRELINNVKIAPTESKYKIYIIDEVHMMTQSAFNALLLTLEEPPAHAVFIMATTNVESVPITILSRCQRFNFKKIALDDLVKQINYVCNSENIKITEDAVLEIANISEGGMRDALSLLDQLAANGEEITVDKILVNYGSISLKFIKDLLTYVEKKDINNIHESFLYLQNTSSDYKVFIKKVVQELANIGVSILNNEYKGSFSYNQIKQIVFELNDILNKVNININPFLLIEMIFLNSFKEYDSEKKLKKVDNYMENVDKILEKKESEKEKEQIIVKNKKEDTIVDQKNDEIYFEKLKKIRVNNCFANATKESLKEVQVIWSKAADYDSIKPSIKAYILDSKVVASSPDYVILMTALKSTAHIINHNLEELSLEFNNIFSKKLNFIVLDEQEWLNARQEYANKIKNKEKYEFISEDEIEELKPKNVSEIEEIATNVFNRDKIEMV